MLKKGTIIFLVLISTLFGVWTVYLSQRLLELNGLMLWSVGIAAGVACILFSGGMFLIGKKGWENINLVVESISIEVLLGGVVGLLGGIVLGFVLGYPFRIFDVVGDYINLFTIIGLGFFGWNVGRKRAYDFIGILPNPNGVAVNNLARNKKVLDTSAIIDGRIYDVILAGFLEGNLVVPSFVIEELRHIADSSDFVRRSKGRRGLEILGKMQKTPFINISIHEGDYPEEREVDTKLLRLCREINASIVTNDYNLNKVAELQGIKVLNVNELTNAVKVIVFPGETMRVNVIKEGKENGQGVGYLEDGTMIVVENGDEDIGQEVEVVVTSVFQTAAGRMIFSRKNREGAKVNQGIPKLQEVNLFG
ncbi:MAG: PIN/TRAM domain-containing protein [Chitinophagales bacterium]